jgi:selenocysteine lyase/cysteine desulfurase
MYVRRDLIDAVPVFESGWKNLQSEGTGWPTEALPDAVAGARRFEPGTPNINGMVMAQAGLELLMATGIDRISAAISSLVGHARSSLVALGLPILTPSDPARRAGLLAFPFAQSVALAGFLRDRGVEITGYPYGLVRIDPHAFNTAAEIETMLELVRAYTREATHSADRSAR